MKEHYKVECVKSRFDDDNFIFGTSLSGLNHKIKRSDFMNFASKVMDNNATHIDFQAWVDNDKKVVTFCLTPEIVKYLTKEELIVEEQNERETYIRLKNKFENETKEK